MYNICNKLQYKINLSEKIYFETSHILIVKSARDNHMNIVLNFLTFSQTLVEIIDCMSALNIFGDIYIGISKEISCNQFCQLFLENMDYK